MPEALQSLLERIQKDGVEQADKKAQEILEKAGKEAESIVEQARKKADDHRARAEKDAEAFAERGRKAVEQAARDVLLTVRQGVESSFSRLVSAEVRDTLHQDALEKMLGHVVEVFLKDPSSQPIELIVPEEQQKQVKDYLTSKYAETLKSGLEIKAEPTLRAGFRVKVEDEHVVYDFSDEAVTEALCQFLRPHLVAIVKGKTEESAATPASDAPSSTD